jgi:hypothetical protein
MVAKKGRAIVDKRRKNNDKSPGGVTGKGFRPGRSGNPAGRPKGQSITALLRAELDKDDNAQALAEMIVRKALSGDIHFCKLILDRTEGKVPDRIAGPDGGPLGPTMDLSLLSDEDLETLLRIFRLITPAGPPDDLSSPEKLAEATRMPFNDLGWRDPMY